MAAQLIFDSLMDSGYRRHMEALRQRLSKARRDTGTQLANLGLIAWVIPRGGFYLWCQLPDGRDAADLAQIALREGVILAPGNVFSAAQLATDFMRFNVTQMQDSRVYEVLKAGLGGESRRPLPTPDQTIRMSADGAGGGMVAPV